MDSKMLKVSLFLWAFIVNYSLGAVSCTNGWGTGGSSSGWCNNNTNINAFYLISNANASITNNNSSNGAFFFLAGANTTHTFSTATITGNVAQGIAFVADGSASIASLTNNGTLGSTTWPSSYRWRSGSTSTFGTRGASGRTTSIFLGSSITLTNLNNTGTITGDIFSYGTIVTIDNTGSVSSITNNGNISAINNQNNGTINTITNNANITTLSNAGNIDTLTNSGSIASLNNSNSIAQLTNNGTITTLDNSGSIASLLGNGNITTLNLYSPLGFLSSDNTINTLNIHTQGAINVVLSSPSSEWNTISAKTSTNQNEHIFNVGTINANVDGAIIVDVLDGAKSGDVYYFDKLALNCSGGSCQSATNADKLTINHLVSGTQGVTLESHTDSTGKTGFGFGLEAGDSYGAAILKTLSLIQMRRDVLINEILDSVTSNNFHTTQIQPILRTYTRGRGGNTQQNEQHLLFDTIDKIFIPYQGEQKLMRFLIPYAVSSKLTVQSRKASELGGGVIGGVEAKVGKASVGWHLGYEYDTAKADLTTTSANMTSNAIFFGLNYYRHLLRSGKQIYYVKLLAQGGVIFPQFFVNPPLANRVNLNLTSYSAGIEGILGANLYSLSNYSYIAPEILLSYNILGLQKFNIQQTGEVYPNHLFTLPQVGAHLKWYRAWGSSFRTSARIGARYNITNAPEVTFTFLNATASGNIDLPKIYSTLNLSAIYAFAKRHQFALDYNGIYFSNGISNALNLRWQMWF